MYQLTNYGGSGLQVVSPDPPDAGGAAINANFKVLATTVAASDPGSDDDSTAGFGVGSRWYNPDSTVEWICLDATPGDAEWAAITSGSLAGYLPLTGGTMTGGLDMAGNPIKMNTGGGTAGGTLVLDGANVFGSAAGSGQRGGAWNLGDGTGANGGALNMEGGTLSMSSSSGTLNMVGATLNLDNSARIYSTSGTVTFAGFGILTMGVVSYNDSGSWSFGGLSSVSMNTGGGTGGGTLNLDGGTLNFDPVASVSGNGAGTLTFSGVSSVVGLPGVSTPTLAEVLTAGPNASGTGINMNTGGGTGGGTLSMDGGTLNMAAGPPTSGGGGTINLEGGILSLDGYAQIYSSGGSVTFNDFGILTMGLISYNNSGNWNFGGLGSINMNDGSGTGGQAFNMDGGTLYLQAGGNGINYNELQNVIALNGQSLATNNGGGSGGGSLSVDGGGITNIAALGGAGGVLGLYNSTTFNVSGNALNMNSGGGTGGATLNMDGGLINFNPDASMPTNTSTPAGWVKIQINGSSAWLPYYT